MRIYLVDERVTLKVQEREVQVSHIDKVVFPESRFTKAHIIDYYIRMSQFILPHLHDRPLTLKLYLNGISKAPEFIKNAPVFTPRWVKRSAVWRRSRASQIHYVLVNDLPTLVWAANLNNIELHTFLARAPQIERPSWIVFDLDPGEPANILASARVALWIHEALRQLNLEAFIKTSGSKGLHLYVPLNSNASYEQTHSFAQAVTEALERQYPDHVVSDMSKSARAGKVFVDYGQNADFKSTACVYSLRARMDGPFVSMPLSWQRLEQALADADAEAFRTRPAEAISICEKNGDAFRPVLTMKQKLPRKLPASRATAKSLRSRTSAKPKATSDAIGTLTRYQRKRDFSKTAEPSGTGAKASGTASRTRSSSREPAPKQRLFVIQKHAASHLHYDFRLEMQGVLRSWAVPKGPPYAKGERRLAMLVEDHPFDYARFEGTIPKGQYGGGTVMVWDIGTYETFGGNPSQEFYGGKLHLHLKGKKLKGEWTLVRSSKADQSGNEPWFLIKTGTDTRPISKRRDDSSALTERSMAQIATQNTAQWDSNR